MSISPPPIEGNAVTTTVNRFFSVMNLNNSLTNVKITVTTRNGKGNSQTFSVELPKPLSMYVCNTYVWFIDM